MTFKKQIHAAHDSRSLNHGRKISGSLMTSRIETGLDSTRALAFFAIGFLIVDLSRGLRSGTLGKVLGQGVASARLSLDRFCPEGGERSANGPRYFDQVVSRNIATVRQVTGHSFAFERQSCRHAHQGTIGLAEIRPKVGSEAVEQLLQPTCSTTPTVA